MTDREKQNYISLARAAEGTPYSQEYLSLLVRKGKIDAKKFGRNWYVTKASVDDYLNRQQKAALKKINLGRNIDSPESSLARTHGFDKSITRISDSISDRSISDNVIVRQKDTAYEKIKKPNHFVAALGGVMRHVALDAILIGAIIAGSFAVGVVGMNIGQEIATDGDLAFAVSDRDFSVARRFMDVNLPMEMSTAIVAGIKKSSRDLSGLAALAGNQITIADRITGFFSPLYDAGSRLTRSVSDFFSPPSVISLPAKSLPKKSAVFIPPSIPTPLLGGSLPAPSGTRAPVSSRTHTTEVTRVTETREVIVPADFALVKSDILASVDLLNADIRAYVNRQISSLSSSVSTVSSQAASGIQMVSVSQDIDNLITPTIQKGMTLASGDFAITKGNIDITSGNINADSITARGALTGGDTTINGGDLIFTSSATTSIVSSKVNAFSIATSTTAVPFMTFDTANYRIGIGTISPAATFSVAGSITADGTLSLLGTGTTTYNGGIVSNGLAAGAYAMAHLGQFGSIQATSTTATSTISTGGLTVGTNQFVVQQNSGNVGVGTTSPGTLFSIQGIANFSNSATSTLYSVLSVPRFAATSTVATSTLSTGGLAIGTNQFIVQQNSGLVGIGTTSPGATMDVVQNTNGAIIYRGRRITDTAPSGDFLRFTSADGATSLFRVDNSGNLTGGGIISSGAISILSTSQPQLRVQYDASNENTTSVTSAGVTSYGFNGTTPTVSWNPQSNSVNTFSFNDSSSNSVLSVDTTNRRVGLASTTPGSILSIQGVGNFVSAATSTLYTSLLLPNFSATSTTATSTLSTGGFNIGSGQFVVQQSSGNVGIGTTSPIANLSVSGSSAAPSLVVHNGGIELTGTASELGTNVGLTRLSDAATILYYGTGSFTFKNASGSGGDKVIINSSGNVGIGDITPAALLTVGSGDPFQVNTTGDIIGNSLTGNGGQMTISSGDSASLMHLSGSGTGAAQIELYGGSHATTPGVTKFLVNSVEKARIDNAGNVGIGTTSPTSLLSIGGTSQGGLWYTGHTLGIATSSPGAALAIATTTAGTNTTFLVSNLGSGYTMWAEDSANDTTPFVIQADGNVGIGTTSPWASLSVSGTGGAATSPLAIIKGTGSSAYLRIESAATAGVGSGFDLVKPGSQTWRVGLGAQTGGNDFEFYDVTNSTERVRITTAGNVGIGTTSPGALFSVHGSGLFSSNLTVGGTLTATSTVLLATSGGNVGIGTTSPGALWAVGNTGGFYVQSGGNVGIGTSTPAWPLAIVGSGQSNDNQGVLHLESSQADLGIRMKNTGTSGRTWTLFSSNSSSGLGAGLFSIFDVTAGAARLNINSSGNVGIGTTSPGALFALGNGAASGGVYITSAGNVGIGKIAPAAPLHVAGRIIASGYTFDSNQAIDANHAFTSPAAYELAFGSGNPNVERVRINSSGNVGIGTTSPSARLSVTSAGTGTGRAFAVADSSNVERLAVLDNGMVGIGTTDLESWHTSYKAIEFPKSSISFASSAGTDKSLLLASNAYINSSGAWTYKSTDTAAEIGLGDGLLVFRVAGSGTVDTAITWTEAMRINNAGNVGIGTTTPAATLNIAGNPATAHILRLEGGSSASDAAWDAQVWQAFHNTNTSANNYSTIFFQTNDTGGTRRNAAGIASIFTARTGTTVSGDLAFGTTNAGTWGERVRITSAGNVGIGTTSPTSLLSIGGTSQGGLWYTGHTLGIATSSPGAALAIATTTAGTNTTFLVSNLGSGYTMWAEDSANDTTPFVIDSTGNVGIGTTSPGSLLSVSGSSGLGVTNTGSGSSFYVEDVANDTTPFVIDATGNVGVGTAGPTYQLDVSGTGNATNFRVTSSGNNSAVTINNSGTGGKSWNISSTNNNTAVGGGKLVIDDGALNLLTIVNTTGNVGIGTTSPGMMLDVSGSASVNARFDSTGTVGSGVRWTARSTGGRDYSWYSTANGAGQGGGRFLVYDETAAATRLTIDSTGNVGIGTTSPGSLLSVSGSSGLGVTNTGAGSSFYVEDVANDTSPFVIDAGGNVGIGTTGPSFPLDVDSSVAGSTKTVRFRNTSNTASSVMRLLVQAGGSSAGDALIQLGVGGGAGTYEWSAGVDNSDSDKFAIAVANNADPVLGTNSVLTIDTSGNVGIGTTSPGSILSVQGVASFVSGTNATSTLYSDLSLRSLNATSTVYLAAGTVNNPSLRLGGDASGWYRSAANRWTFSDSASNVLEYDASALALKSYYTGLFGWASAGANGSPDTALGRNAAGVVEINNGTLGTLRDLTARSASTTGQTVLATGSGNVGIGTTSPGSILSVQGVGNFASTNSYLYPILNLPSLVATSTTATSTIAGGLTIETSGFVYDYSTNRVGIGTAAPGYALDVNVTTNLGGIRVTGSNDNTSLVIVNTDTNGKTWSVVSAGQGSGYGEGNLAFIDGADSDVPTMVIGGSGNVGIGTTSPGALLSVSGAGFGNYRQLYVAGSSTTGGGMTLQASGGIPWSLLATGAGAVQGANKLLFYRDNTDNNSASMVIDASGNVGIGTTSPYVKLGVVGGNIEIDNNQYYRSRDTTGVAYNLLGITSSNNGQIVSPGDFVINTNGGSGAGANALVVKSTGNVGIGTTSPDAVLAVSGSSIDFANPSGSIITRLNSSGTNNVQIQFEQGGVDRGYLTYYNTAGVLNLCRTGATETCGLSVNATDQVLMSGNVGIGTTSPTSLLSIGGTSQGGLWYTGHTLGIATSSPGAALAIATTTAGTNTTFLVSNLGSGYTMWAEDSANDTTPFVIQADGNVGIGTTEPGAKLDVKGATGAWTIRALASDAGQIGGFFENANTSGALYLYQSDGSTVGVRIESGDNSYFNGGNVGIGTTSPYVKLGVVGGNVEIDNNQYYRSRDTTGTSYNLIGITSSNNGQIVNPGDLVINTNGGSGAGVNALVVKSTGNVGIGTSSPVRALSVYRSGADAAANHAAMWIGTSQTGVSGLGPAIYLDGTSFTSGRNWSIFSAGPTDISGGAGTFAIYDVTAGANRLNINSSGNVGIGTTSPGAILAIKQSAATSGILLTSSSDGDYRHIYMDSSSVMNFLGDGAGTSNTATLAANGTWTNAPSFSYLKEQRSVLTRDEVLGVLASTTIERFKIKAEVAQYGANADLNLGIILDEAHSWLSDHNTAGEIVGYSPMRTASVAFRAAQILTGVIDIRNASTTLSALVIDANGNVGIGTTTPDYKLRVEGDIAAYSFVNISTKSAKEDIISVDTKGEDKLLKSLLSATPTTYQYKGDTANETHLGLIAEDAPEEIQSANGKGIDLYKMATALLAGMKAQERKIQELDAAITGSRTPDGIPTNAWAIDQQSGKVNVSFFGDINMQNNSILDVKKITGYLGKWSMDEEGTLMAVRVITDELIAQKITIGSAAAPSGITLYDEITREPYCVKMRNGAMVSDSGACGIVNPNDKYQMSNQIQNSNDQTAPTTTTTIDPIASSTPITTETNASSTPVTIESIATSTVSLAQ